MTLNGQAQARITSELRSLYPQGSYGVATALWLGNAFRLFEAELPEHSRLLMVRDNTGNVVAAMHYDGRDTRIIAAKVLDGVVVLGEVAIYADREGAEIDLVRVVWEWVSRASH